MRTKRRHGGSTLPEMPAAMLMLFVGLLIPCIGLVTYGYRASLMYFCTRDTAYQASKQTTFTKAKTQALTTWTNDLIAWPGNSGTETPYIVVHPLNGTAETKFLVPLVRNPDTTANLYFVRVVTVCSIPPMFGGSWLGQAIPGLTTPYLLQMSYQFFAENPAGLTQ